MQEVFTRARLADLATVAEERGMSATVPRREIEDAVRAAEGQPELLLDVRMSGSNGGPRVETRRVAIEWERSDLEALLKQARGENVTFSIDLDSLVRALEASDVEAHGLREAAAALTVAVAVAAPGAAAAGGHPAADSPGSPGVGVVEAARGAPEGIPAGFSTVEETRGAEGGTASQGLPSGYSSVEETRRAGGGAPQEIPAGYSAVEETRGVEGATAPEGLPSGYSTVEETRRAGGGAPEGIPAGYSTVEGIRGVQGGTAPMAAYDDGVTISAPGLATSLGIAGAITLAIAGAAFAVRGRRGEQPA
ncbi:MAG: hypothetical protein ACRDON_05130 [Gaiellaceae bacterium]